MILEAAVFGGDADFSEGLLVPGLEALRPSPFDALETPPAVASPSTLGPAALHGAKAVFMGDAFFDRRTFRAEVDFSGARFRGMPSFHGSTLPQLTTLYQTRFDVLETREPGPLSSPEGSAGRVEVDPTPLTDPRLEAIEAAFRSLKYAMEAIRAHRQESRFFKLELTARRMRRADPQVPGWERLASRLYGLVSDYGDSLLRPLTVLFCASILCAVAYWLLQPLAAGTALSLADLGDALQHSLGRAVIVGAYGGEEASWDWYSSWANQGSALSWAGGMRVISMLQSILSVLLAFLIALALRRKFRIT